MKRHFVFMCPQCHHFTLAPVGQKRRRCSYCGKMINIRKAAKAMFDSQPLATQAVKDFNAAKGSGEFEKAVERSREKIMKLVPEDRIEARSLDSESDSGLPSGKTKRLMVLLEKEAKKDACSLGKIEELCEEYRLDWVWVEEQLTKMANAGAVIFPRPWTVKLVPSVDSKDTKAVAQVDVSKDIVCYLREHAMKAKLEELVSYFDERGISRVSVENSLAKLLRRGEIFEPRSGVLALIEPFS